MCKEAATLTLCLAEHGKPPLVIACLCVCLHNMDISHCKLSFFSLSVCAREINSNLSCNNSFTLLFLRNVLIELAATLMKRHKQKMKWIQICSHRNKTLVPPPHNLTFILVLLSPVLQCLAETLRWYFK